MNYIECKIYNDEQIIKRQNNRRDAMRLKRKKNYNFQLHVNIIFNLIHSHFIKLFTTIFGVSQAG